MRFSIWPSLTQPWDDVLAVAHHAEATGWDGVYAADHFMGDAGAPWPVEIPTLVATAVLAALATATERVRLSPLVLGITYRHPAVLAKWAATVDHVSNGRLLLGVGAGWQENEHEQYGIALGSPGERIERFEEAVRILRGLLRDDRTTVVSRYYEVRDAIAEPKPVQERLPILIGGKGDRMLGVVARHADEWNMWSDPQQFAARSAILDQRCAVIDRDPATIRRSTQALFSVTDDPERAKTFAERVAPRPAVAGTPAQIAETVAAWQDAGVDELIIPDFTLGSGSRRTDTMDAIIEEIAPAFRS